jgi:tetratricopeptide (TPR) repeat protein
MSDAKRLKALLGIIEKIQAGKHVQNRTLQTHLTVEEYKEYLNERKQQKSLRVDIKDKPAEVIEYESLLRSANLIYNRADAYSRRGKANTAQKLFNNADTLYERAMEHLEEVIAADYSLTMWFDRNTEWSVNNNDISLDPVGMPKCVNSRSLDNLSSGHFLKNEIVPAAELKLRVVQRAYDSLNADKTADNYDTQKSKLLIDFLNTLDNEDF